MNTVKSGLTADTLFVGATRPSMRWGVTYSALMFNMVFTMEVFLAGKNLLSLSICVPIHVVCLLLCLRDARFFDLLLLSARTKIPAYFANWRYWRASSYSPLALDTPGRSGRRRRSDGIIAMVHVCLESSAVLLPATARSDAVSNQGEGA